MKKIEEYEIEKNSVGKIIKDGVYYSALRDRLYADFKKDGNADIRIRQLEENAEQIFHKIQVLDKGKKENKNILLVGKVQSGKTCNMEMATALAFDNGFNFAVIYAGYDNTLVDQAIDRFSEEAFKKPDDVQETSWVNIFTSREGKCHEIDALDEDVIEQIITDNGKIVIMCLKNAERINEINSLLSDIDSDLIKPIILDDEGDQASLNTQFRKNNESSTYNSIKKMKEILNDPPYLSVTATPQALVFSPKNSKLKPQMLQLIHPGEGYAGLESFHLNSSNIIEVDKKDCAALLSKTDVQIPNSLWDSIFEYLIVSAILLHKQIMKKTQMIIHFDKLTKKHEFVYDRVTNFIDNLKKNIKYNQTDTLERKLFEFSKVFENDDLVSKDIKGNLKFVDIKNELLEVIKRVYPALMNSKGKETMAKLPYKNYQIRIGADLLQRGVTFKYLITTYFTRMPKGTTNMDTQIQRARWLGYRSKFFKYCRVFTSEDIDTKFATLATEEIDLWDQMNEVEIGKKSIDEIIIAADPKMIPSRRNASDFTYKTFGRKWMNQSIGLSDKTDIDKNNKILEFIIEKHKFTPICNGSTSLQPEKVTAYKTRIDNNELKTLLLSTIDIFDNDPFNDPKKILKIAEDKKIDLLLFWNPNSNINYLLHDFKKDMRSRRFRHTESGYRVSALQQGADSIDESTRKYLGDASVISDSDAITIQVFPVIPKAKNCPEQMLNKFQYMYSIHMPIPIAVYSRNDE